MLRLLLVCANWTEEPGGILVPKLIEGATSRMAHLEKIGHFFFQVHHSQSFLIFSILNHHCSWLVYHLFGVFLPVSKLLFWGFLQFEVDFALPKNGFKISWHSSFNSQIGVCSMKRLTWSIDYSPCTWCQQCVRIHVCCKWHSILECDYAPKWVQIWDRI